MEFYRNYIRYCDKLQKEDKYIDFSSNDYLGLSRSPQVIEAAKRTVEQFGVGSTGSRLLSGNNLLFEELETQIARDKKQRVHSFLILAFKPISACSPVF